MYEARLHWKRSERGPPAGSVYLGIVCVVSDYYTTIYTGSAKYPNWIDIDNMI